MRSQTFSTRVPFHISDADRALEPRLKEDLDALGYPFRFLREYDEPNDSFAPRLARALPGLAPLVSALPIWPNLPQAIGASGRHRVLSSHHRQGCL